LRRRANHRHKFSIAKILIKRPRRETGRGLFQSDGDPHFGRTISQAAQASQSALPSEPFSTAGTRERAGTRRGQSENSYTC
jgi:hypothetical protein